MSAHRASDRDRARERAIVKQALAARARRIERALAALTVLLMAIVSALLLPLLPWPIAIAIGISAALTVWVVV